MQIKIRSAAALALCLAVFAIAGCSTEGLDVTAKFENTQDISEGTKVYFGKKVAGSVSDISKTEYGSVVKMSLDTELAQTINSKAAVVVNRLRQGAPLELHNPPGDIKQALQHGQTITGLDSMLQLVGWGVGSTFEAGTESIGAFKDYLQSDQFERDKVGASVAIDRSLKTAKDSIKDAGEALENVVKEIDLSEEELAAVVEELGLEMAPMVKEFAQSGTELMVELDRFVQNLEQSSGSDQQSGELFLESLTRALEGLNKSFDDGVEQGLDSDKN